MKKGCFSYLLDVLIPLLMVTLFFGINNYLVQETKKSKTLSTVIILIIGAIILITIVVKCIKNPGEKNQNEQEKTSTDKNSSIENENNDKQY